MEILEDVQETPVEDRERQTKLKVKRLIKAVDRIIERKCVDDPDMTIAYTLRKKSRNYVGFVHTLRFLCFVHRIEVENLL